MGDTLWLWPSGKQYGRFVALLPAFLLGKPFWSNPRAYRLVSAMVPVGSAAFLAYWILLAIGIYLDARKRGERALAWGMIALATNLVGLAAYLLARSAGPRAPCASCAKPLQPTWYFCPHCGTPHNVR